MGYAAALKVAELAGIARKSHNPPILANNATVLLPRPRQKSFPGDDLRENSSLEQVVLSWNRHREERSDAAIQESLGARYVPLDCFAPLAMTSLVQPIRAMLQSAAKLVELDLPAASGVALLEGAARADARLLARHRRRIWRAPDCKKRGSVGGAIRGVRFGPALSRRRSSLTKVEIDVINSLHRKLVRWLAHDGRRTDLPRSTTAREGGKNPIRIACNPLKSPDPEK
jgi:hypothetical protein